MQLLQASTNDRVRIRVSLYKEEVGDSFYLIKKYLKIEPISILTPHVIVVCLICVTILFLIIAAITHY